MRHSRLPLAKVKRNSHVHHLVSAFWCLQILLGASMWMFAGAVPSAWAVTLERLGATDPGVQGMWGQVLSIFPHTGVGAGAPLLFGLRIIAFILSTIAAVGVALIIYAGILMTVSAADSGKREESKKILINVAIGLILAMLADAIVLYVLNLVVLAS